MSHTWLPIPDCRTKLELHFVAQHCAALHPCDTPVILLWNLSPNIPVVPM